MVVSLFYLIPQMVGAGALVTPLLGFPHWVGVVLVGSIVIFIVATAGMTSTTYVQFIKGFLLIIFSLVIVFYVLKVGLKTKPGEGYHNFITLNANLENGKLVSVADSTYRILSQHDEKDLSFVKLEKDGIANWWKINTKGETPVLEAVSYTHLKLVLIINA